MKILFVASAIFFCACSSDGNNSNNANNTDDTGLGDTANNQNNVTVGYSTCEAADHVGTFAVKLDDGFTTVQGQVSDAVDPNTISVADATSGACTLFVPPQNFCDPGCAGGTTCAADGSCVALPVNRDVGEVTITGLTAEVTMTSRAPVFFYTFIGDLPHPGFDPSTTATLTTAGGDFDPFTIEAPGTATLTTDLTDVAIDVGTGAALSWDASAANDGVRVEIEMNIANHGGTPARIECLVDDTGSFTIPSELVDTLLSNGYSGFPSVRITRQGARSVSTGAGCVDLRLISQVVLPVEIPGLVSCSLPEDCPNGQTCLDDLTCG